MSKNFDEQTNFDGLKTRIENINLLLVGVIVVLFVGFLTLLFSLGALLVSAWEQRPISYERLVNQVETQSVKIDFIYNALHSAPR